LIQFNGQANSFVYDFNQPSYFTDTNPLCIDLGSQISTSDRFPGPTTTTTAVSDTPTQAAAEILAETCLCPARP